MKLIFALIIMTTFSMSVVSPSFAGEYNGMTFGDYPIWADEAFEPQGN